MLVVCMDVVCMDVKPCLTQTSQLGLTSVCGSKDCVLAHCARPRLVHFRCVIGLMQGEQSFVSNQSVTVEYYFEIN